MRDTTRILFLSANPWTTSRILVDEEAREVFERLQEGPYRDRFELYKHEAIRPIDLQRFLMMYEPHIVHFSGHGSKRRRIILGGAPGRGKQVNCRGLVEVLALYRSHLRLVLLNACFTKEQARSIAEVIDYAVGTGKGIGDKGGVAFAGAFYRALGFGRDITEAFASAKAELALTNFPRTKGIELFVRSGVSETQFQRQQFRLQTVNSVRILNYVRRDDGDGDCSTSTLTKGDSKMRNKTKSVHTSSAKGERKQLGTRAGTLQDWREGSGKSSKHSRRSPHAPRDGR